MFGTAARAAGWSGRDATRWAALGVALLGWLVVLLPWYRTAEVRRPEGHQKGMYLALGAWAVTDVVVLFAWA